MKQYKGQNYTEERWKELRELDIKVHEIVYGGKCKHKDGWWGWNNAPCAEADDWQEINLVPCYSIDVQDANILFDRFKYVEIIKDHDKYYCTIDNKNPYVIGETWMKALCLASIQK